MRYPKNFTRIAASVLQAVTDAAIFRLSFWLAVNFLMAGKNPHPLPPEANIFLTGTMLAVFCFSSLYSFKTWLLWDEMRTVIKSSFLILLVAVLFLYSQGHDISRFMIAAGTLIFIPLCIMSRYVFRRTIYSLGIMPTNIIILGAGRTGEIFADKITDHPFTLGRVIGFLDDDEKKQGITVAGYKVLGTLNDFEAVYAKVRIDEAAVAISTASRKLLTRILDLVEFRVKQVHYIPDLYMLTTFSSSVRDVDGMPVIPASQGLLNPVNRALKYFADYAGALLGLAVLSPVMLYCAIKVKRDYGGEIFSRQKKAGLNGKVFTLYKFRTSGLGKTGGEFRRSYMDDIPQLFNVLRGEMSLVGPKALKPEDMERFYGEETARKISAVKPGIIGFRQMSLRENDKRMFGEMDLYYIRNWSLWIDIVIIIKTISITLFHVGNKKNSPR